MKKLKILTPKHSETVFSYIEDAKKYLLDEEYMKAGVVGKYRPDGVSDGVAPVVVSWECEETPLFYRVHLWERETGEEKRFETSKNTFSIYNLYKATAYLLRVEAVFDNGETIGDECEFYTAELGPRVLYAEGIVNIRDIGGYIGIYGKRTRQGRIYRSMGFEPMDMPDGAKVALTGEGAKTLMDELCIKTELDIRNYDIPRVSIVERMNYIHYGLRPYTAFFEFSEQYLSCLRVFTKEENYPIVFHCFGGADRTGTMALLLESILGYDDKTIINDYEFTSFSHYGLRDKHLTTETHSGDSINGMLTRIEEAFSGKTIAERVVKYLLSIGLTEGEMDAIRRNML